MIWLKHCIAHAAYIGAFCLILPTVSLAQGKTADPEFDALYRDTVIQHDRASEAVANTRREYEKTINALEDVEDLIRFLNADIKTMQCAGSAEGFEESVIERRALIVRLRSQIVEASQRCSQISRIPAPARCELVSSTVQRKERLIRMLEERIDYCAQTLRREIDVFTDTPDSRK